MELFSWILFILTIIIGSLYVEANSYDDKESNTNKWAFAVILTFILTVASTTLNDNFASYTHYTKHDVTSIDKISYSTPKEVEVTVMTYPWWSINDPVETYHVVGE